METETVTTRETQQQSEPVTPGDGAGKDSPLSGFSLSPPLDAASRAKDAKPAVERKRSRNLSEDKRFKLFSGTANRPLAEEIGRHIGVPVGEAKIQRFADGEVYFQLLENVRGVDVFVVQPTCYPVDRKDRPRVAISAKLIADLLTTAGANRALFVDLHAAQIQGFFNIPVDHLFASPVLVSYFRELNLPNLTVVSPDAGGVERARFFAQKVGAPMAIVDKRRTDMNVAEVMNVVGDVNGRTCLILDDIIDTAGTLVKTVDALYSAGASTVYAGASHAVLSGPAIDRIANSRLEEVVVTNTIPLREAAQKLPKIKVLSIAGLLGAAIESIHMETSVSTLFS
jgi:ribose-phosphate pyrophosphokinase